MAVNPIFSSTINPVNLDRIPKQTLNQQDFLNLLTTQMGNQDPLEPMSDTEFISQMAQFTALEQSKADYNLALANAMMGNFVEVHIETEGGVQVVNGTVSGIDLEQGTPKVIVNNGSYSVDKVVWFIPQDPNNL